MVQTGTASCTGFGVALKAGEFVRGSVATCELLAEGEKVERVHEGAVVFGEDPRRAEMVGEDELCARRADQVLSDELPIHAEVDIHPDIVLVYLGNDVTVQAVDVIRLSSANRFCGAAAEGVVKVAGSCGGAGAPTCRLLERGDSPRRRSRCGCRRWSCCRRRRTDRASHSVGFGN